MAHHSPPERKVTRVRLSLVLVGALVACSGDTSPMTGPFDDPSAGGSAPLSAVASITVTPPSISGMLGASIQFSAAEKNIDGQLISGQAVTWTSSDSTIVAVSPSGLAVDVGIGLATITATAGNNVSGAATQAVVGGAAVASAAIAPTQVSVGMGQTARFAATLTDVSGNVLAGRRVLWQSSNPAVMRVDSTGLGTPAGAGTAVITASSAGVSAAANVVVSSALVLPPGAVTDLIVVSTTDSSATVQFTQASNGSGGTTVYDVRAAVGAIAFNTTASVTRGTCATPLAGTGGPGKLSCTVLGLPSATQFSVQLVAYTGTLNVNAVQGALSNIAAGATLAAVASATMSPATAVTAVGAPGAQFTLVLKDAAGNVLPVQTAAWSSSNPAVASVSAIGLASGIAPGAATITATIGSVIASASLTVVASTAPGTPNSPPTTQLSVASVTVTPSGPTYIVGAGSQQFAALMKDATGSVITSANAAWSSSNLGVATISASGLATAVSSGTATITATSGGASGSTSLVVSAQSPLPAAPGTVSDLKVVAINDTAATVSFTEVSDGNGGAASVDVRFAVAPISWGSATPVSRGTCATAAALASVGSVAQCTVFGLTKATSYNFQLVTYRGTLNQNAVFGSTSNIASGATTTAPAAPAAAIVGSVTVTPATSLATVGVALTLTATVKDKTGNVITGQLVTWTSNNSAVATVTAGGVATGIAAGTVILTATVSGVSGTATITEQVAPPATQSGSATLTGVSRDGGSAAGGAKVTLTGSGFGADAVVTFAGVRAPSVTVVNATTLTVVVPAGTATNPTAPTAGAVSVTTGGATATLANAWTYWPAPTHVLATTDFENGSVNSADGQLAPSNGVGPFTDGSSISVTTEQAHSGTHSLKQVATETTNNWVGYQGSWPQTDIVGGAGRWHRWYMFVPAATLASVANNGQIKLFLSRTDGPTTWFTVVATGAETRDPGSDGVNALGANVDASNDHINDVTAHTGVTPLITAGTWHEVQVYEYRNPTQSFTDPQGVDGKSSGYGYTKVWWDGKLIADSQNMYWQVQDQLGSNTATALRTAQFGLTYTQNALTYPLVVYIDDITIANGYIDPPSP